MQTARHYLLYPISLILYFLTTLPHVSPRSLPEKYPRSRKKMFIVMVIGAIAISATAITIGQFLVHQQHQSQEEVPDVKFMTFEVNKQKIAVGETANVLINVRNSEDKVIEDAKVVMAIEPTGHESYLTISNSSIQLPTFLGKDARTGEVKDSITATATPAKEAVYIVKGIVFVNGIQTDIKEFPLTIHQ